MKNLKTFENYNSISSDLEALKKHREHFPLSNLSNGDKVSYMGSEYIIDEASPYSIKLVSPSGGKTLLVNQKMFDEKGYISKNNTPKNYRG